MRQYFNDYLVSSFHLANTLVSFSKKRFPSTFLLDVFTKLGTGSYLESIITDWRVFVIFRLSFKENRKECLPGGRKTGIT